MSRVFSFGTKSENLEQIVAISNRVQVPRFLYFSQREWAQDWRQVMANIQANFSEGNVAVRSSAVSEDSVVESQAGKFDSYLGVSTDAIPGIAEAIRKVLEVMGPDPRNQVMVQEMVENSRCSGVLTTVDQDTGAPYFHVDFDDSSGRTDTITSGSSPHKSLFVLREARLSAIRSRRMAAAVELAKELEEITGIRELDIEFAINQFEEILLLQVRPIVPKKGWLEIPQEEFRETVLSFQEREIPSLTSRSSLVEHTETLFSAMADWNPAEIIGFSPRPLARSLYQAILMDSKWKAGRATLGFRDPGNFQLMQIFLGHVYVDVGLSFESFLPANLDPMVARKILSAWLTRLKLNPGLHDKVEFEIASTVFNFTFDDRAADNFDGWLSGGEIEEFRCQLQELSTAIIGPVGRQAIEQALQSASELKGFCLDPIDLNSFSTIVRASLETIQSNGAQPFSLVARTAFMAEDLLRSAVAAQLISGRTLDSLRKSVKTVTSDYLEALVEVREGRASEADFMSRFGHLRPGTYEITSERYGGSVLKSSSPTEAPPPHRFRFPPREERALTAGLHALGYEISGDQLAKYYRKAVAAREEIKFEFTRVLSDALEGVAEFFEEVGLERELVSFIELDEMLRVVEGELEGGAGSLVEILRELAQGERKTHSLLRMVKVPPLLSRDSNLEVLPESKGVPNFVGSHTAAAELVELTPNSVRTTFLEGKIALIESADPGFDWIFGSGILGLITKFGGANSHMAIRCSELGLPAAIGCGEQTFRRLRSATWAEIDSLQRTLRFH